MLVMKEAAFWISRLCLKMASDIECNPGPKMSKASAHNKAFFKRSTENENPHTKRTNGKISSVPPPSQVSDGLVLSHDTAHANIIEKLCPITVGTEINKRKRYDDKYYSKHLVDIKRKRSESYAKNSSPKKEASK